MRRLAVLLALTAAACFSPALEYDEGKLACAEGDEPCPSGYQCFEGRCYRRMPVPMPDAPVVVDEPDAPLSEPDAPPSEPDAPPSEPDAPLSEPDASLSAPDAAVPDAPLPPDAAVPDAPAAPDASAPDARSPDAAAPPLLTIDPPDIDLGSVTTGMSSSTQVTITNEGGTTTEPLATSLMPAGAPFSFGDNQCGGAALMPGTSCTLDLVFAPAAAGPDSTTLRVATGAIVATAPVAGDGLPPGALSVTPNPAAFVTTAVGSTSAQVHVQVKNTGGGTVTALDTSLTGTHSAQFSIAADGCDGEDLDPNETCTIDLVFSPSGGGAKSASLLVEAGSGESASTALAGTGTARLTLDFLGAGGGSVDSDPNGVDCSGDCFGDFSTSSVALAATPNATSTFSGWGGACGGNGACNVTLDGNKTVSATFAKKQYTLTIMKTGAGAGTVTSTNVAGISCGSTCDHAYDVGTSIMLSAAPGGGSTFSSWSGGGCTGNAGCLVTLNADTTVTASFASGYTLNVSMSAGNTGTGTIQTQDGFISCPGTCSHTYASGTVVTISHTSAAGSAFLKWGGAGCYDYTPTCDVTMSANRTLTSEYMTADSETFTLASGSIGGKLTTADGVCTFASAGQMCTLKFADNVATFTFFEPPGYFEGGGGCNQGSASCLGTWGGTSTVRFGYVGFEIQFSGTGAGTVVSTPAGINCTKGSSTNCAASFTLAQVDAGIMFMATATSGSFKTWFANQGTVSSSTANPVTISDSASYTVVTARFDP